MPLNRITEADLRLFRRIAGWRSSPLARLRRRPATPAERLMTVLSHAADMSRIWFGCAAALFGLGGRSGKRAAGRGIASIAATSVVVNFLLKPLVRRKRPARDRIPAARQLVRQPQTTSFPSGHAASAAAFATGVALERPAAGAALAPLAAAVAYSRIFNGVHYPLDVAGGLALGSLVALAGRRLWPSLAQDEQPAALERRQRVTPRPRGEGAAVIVNPASGSRTDLARPSAAEIQELLPEAEVIELGEEDDPAATARRLAKRAEVLGVCGGDGTMAAAAQAAFEAGLPLLVFPGGTMNHLARDLGIEGADDAVRALAAGEAARIDVASVDGSVFVNNATLGAHVELVESRRRLAEKTGRWPAQALAAARALLKSEPVHVRLDGKPRELWLGFFGNGTYHDRGIAPGWRRSLDSGVLDVRLLEATGGRSRARGLLALLLAGTGRDRDLRRAEVRSLRLEPLEGPLRVTRDGEMIETEEPVLIASHRGALLAYSPAGGPARSA